MQLHSANVLAFLAFLGTVASAAVGPTMNASEYSQCGTPSPSPEYMNDNRERTAAYQKAALASGNTTMHITTNLVVDLYFHVVAASDKVEDGMATTDMLVHQLRVLQERYRPVGIQFNWKDTTFKIHPDWAVGKNELEMKKALRQGDYRTLNIYYLKTLGDEGDIRMGSCLYPTDDAVAGSEWFWYDGCRVRHTTLPGGTEVGYNHGITTVHEVGHWFGLLHTFQFGCDGGDEVDDTPNEAYASKHCIERNTCPSLPGMDPIHNYMDYSPDNCMTHFTPGQLQRMYVQWNLYRATWGS